MYTLIAFGIFASVWMVFVYRTLLNIKRENEIKRNNQDYYDKKITDLYVKTTEKETGESEERETF